jgi:hypothetical protein
VQYAPASEDDRQFTMPITRCYIRIDVTSPDLRSGSGAGYPREVA